MSKNIKIFIYITISISALIFLLISFVSIKASFGGLNLNIFGERISDELKLNYSFDTDVENIVLKRSSEKGFYLEIEKIQISDANGLVLETSLISWDFNLFNLITFSIDEKNKISSEKINIFSNDFQIFINNFNMEYDELDRVVVSFKKIDFKSKHYALNFESFDNNILIHTNSILEIFDSKSLMSANLSINKENFQTNFEFIPASMQINILQFSGDYFYMNETCCNSIRDATDYSNGTLPGLSAISDQSLCVWQSDLYSYYDYRLGETVTNDYGYCQTNAAVRHIVGSTTAKCMEPKLDVYGNPNPNRGTLNVTALGDADFDAYDDTECACLRGDQYANPTILYKPTLDSSGTPSNTIPGDDDQCPHKGKCYLDMGITCPEYKYTGL